MEEDKTVPWTSPLGKYDLRCLGCVRGGRIGGIPQRTRGIQTLGKLRIRLRMARRGPSKCSQGKKDRFIAHFILKPHGGLRRSWVVPTPPDAPAKMMAMPVVLCAQDEAHAGCAAQACNCRSIDLRRLTLLPQDSTIDNSSMRQTDGGWWRAVASGASSECSMAVPESRTWYQTRRASGLAAFAIVFLSLLLGGRGLSTSSTSSSTVRFSIESRFVPVAARLQSAGSPRYFRLPLFCLVNLIRTAVFSAPTGLT